MVAVVEVKSEPLYIDIANQTICPYCTYLLIATINIQNLNVMIFLSKPAGYKGLILHKAIFCMFACG
jgi:hypothetical protein